MKKYLYVIGVYQIFSSYYVLSGLISTVLAGNYTLSWNDIFIPHFILTGVSGFLLLKKKAIKMSMILLFMQSIFIQNKFVLYILAIGSYSLIFLIFGDGIGFGHEFTMPTGSKYGIGFNNDTNLYIFGINLLQFNFAWILFFINKYKEDFSEKKMIEKVKGLFKYENLPLR
jgi:hypothetical protein